MGIRAVALVVGLASPGMAMADGWAFDATAGIVSYENVGKSRNPADYRGATAFELDAVLQTQPAWRTPGVVSFEAWAGLDRFDTLAGLDTFRIGVGASYVDRIGLGRGAPWWSVSARIGRHAFRDAKRDSDQWELAAGIGRSFGRDVDVALRAVHTHRDGAVRVFDTTTDRIGADVDWRAGARWGLFASVAFLRGELSSALGDPLGGTGPVVIADPVFGPGWRSYRVESDVRTLALGGLFDIGPTTQVVASWERNDGRARNFPADYDGDLYRLQVTHAF